MANEWTGSDQKKKEDKTNTVEIMLSAVTDGEIISVEQVEDDVFSQKMIGDGYAIKPTSEVVYAPVSGKLIEVADAKHAYYIETDSGLKILIHIGIDTLLMNGIGFQTSLEKNTRVEKGDQLATFDQQLIQDKGFDPVIPVIVLEHSSVVALETFPNKEAVAKKTNALKVTVTKG
ncbi:PTS sugar transporter subunit IIA [Alkalibacterium kapii]|uniref:PTS glucose transporter subunit IIA n=1 Tax=Alkalibacterium kapii TaxID=426704 RepID=A0A511ARM1_9LACT|nr:PTS glucose transporter subunit IIA [Alkalibacterium kapii]GEK90855.1 PTS glucose transporter subunit IIA [Alkalibacterium kapii]